MKLYQPIKVENLWNEAVHEHVEKSRGCQGKLMFDETGEKKVGLCWRERLKCSDCPYVSAHLVKVNQDDMSEICRDIGKINEAKGLPTDAAIRVEADARYNNPLYSGSGHTPFQQHRQSTPYARTPRLKRKSSPSV